MVRLRGIVGVPWLLVGGLALADSTGPPVDLEWVAPPQCPNQSAVLREVARSLGDQPSVERRIAARAEVWRGEDTRWHASLTSTGTGSATRKLDADSCEAVANAAALILALMVSPSRGSEGEGAPATPSASGAPAVAPVPAEPAPRPAPSDRVPAVVGPAARPTGVSAKVSANIAPHAGAAPRERDIESQGRIPRWAIGVLGGVSVGALPAAQPQAEVVTAWLTKRFRIELAGRSDWSSQHVSIASRANEGADFYLLSGLARGCYSLLPSRLSLGACAVFELEWLHASGFGANPRNGDALMPALGAAALATYGIGDRFAIRILLEGVAPLARPPFVIIGAGASAVVDRPAAVWGRAMLGAEFRFF